MSRGQLVGEILEKRVNAGKHYWIKKVQKLNLDMSMCRTREQEINTIFTLCMFLKKQDLEYRELLSTQIGCEQKLGEMNTGASEIPEKIRIRTDKPERLKTEFNPMQKKFKRFSEQEESYPPDYMVQNGRRIFSGERGKFIRRYGI